MRHGSARLAGPAGQRAAAVVPGKLHRGHGSADHDRSFQAPLQQQSARDPWFNSLLIDTSKSAHFRGDVAGTRILQKLN
jgi:hypothetical protein